MANNAFDAMNESAGGDMYITGGAITMSEYEQNMSPNDQREYENTLMGLFQQAYINDSLLQKYPNVSFKHWLSTINGDDWQDRAYDYEEAEVGNPRDEQIYLLQRLAHLHTGLIEDVVKIVEPLAQDEAPSSMDTSQQGIFDYKGTNEELMQGVGLDPGSIPKNPAQGG